MMIGLRAERRRPVDSFVYRTFERDVQIVGRSGVRIDEGGTSEGRHV
jgi:hypothetical protein